MLIISLGTYYWEFLLTLIGVLSMPLAMPSTVLIAIIMFFIRVLTRLNTKVKKVLIISTVELLE